MAGFGFTGSFGLPYPPAPGGNRKQRERAETRQDGGHGAPATTHLLIPVIQAGLHVGLQRLGELLWVFLQPDLGTGELQTTQQSRLLVAAFRLQPLPQVGLQLLGADQHITGFIQPPPQKGPLAQQRFVGHLHETRVFNGHGATVE